MSKFGKALKNELIEHIKDTASHIKKLQDLNQGLKSATTLEDLFALEPSHIRNDENDARLLAKMEMSFKYEIPNIEFQVKLLLIEKLMMMACLNLSKSDVYTKYVEKWDETAIAYQELLTEGVQSGEWAEGCYLDCCKGSLVTRTNVLGLQEMGKQLGTGFWNFENITPIVLSRM